MTNSLHILFKENPESAQLAVDQYSRLLDDQLKLSPEYRPFSTQEVADMKAQLLGALIRLERERYIDTIIEISEVLPVLHAQDPAQAATAVDRYSALLDQQLSLAPDYRPFSPKEVAYLKGHLRAYQQDQENLYNYYLELINQSQIVDDQPSMYYLLYLLQMQAPQRPSTEASKNLLQALMTNSGQDKSQFLYGFLWVDHTAALGDEATAAEKLGVFRRTRELVSGDIVPRKAEIAQRIQNLANDPFFNDPSIERATVLQTETIQIRSDLVSLYDDMLPLEGLVHYDEIANLKARELELVDSFRTAIFDYYDQETWLQGRIDASYQILASLSDSQVYFSELVAKIESVFDTTELQYGDEYAFYLDVETKILLDLVGASTIYAHAAELIEIEIASSPQWDPSQTMNARGRKALYLNEATRLLAEFDTRYAQFAEESPWKTHYDTVIDNYVMALRQQISIESGIIEAQYALENLERRRIASVGIPTLFDLSSGPITELSSIYEAHYVFITLQRDFRLLQYREHRRLENIGNMSYQENVAILNAINQGKQDYITRAQNFVAQYPDFVGFIQPTGEYLVSNADIYYSMAEFQYSLDPINPSPALANYKRVREIDPRFVMIDRVNYNIGFIGMVQAISNVDERRSAFYTANPTVVTYSDDYRLQENDFAESIAGFRAVTEGQARQELKDESRLHLATIYFLLASDSTNPETNVNLALSYLNPLVQDENNSRHYEALYQRGVVHMNFGGDTGYRNAINDYTSLLMGIKTGKVTDPALIQDYEDAAVDNIAFALIAMDGSEFEATAQGTQLEEFLMGYENEDVIARIYEKAAMQKKLDLNSPLQARDFLMAKIRRLPRALENPADISRTVLLYNQHYVDLSPERQRTSMNPLTYRFNQYQYLIDRYDRDSVWYEANKNDPTISQQLAVIDTAFAVVETRLTNNFATALNSADMSQAQKQEAFAAYEAHIQKWEAFSELHAGRLAERKDGWDSNLMNYSASLAESSNSPEDWYKAALRLTAFNDANPDDASFQYEGVAFTFAQRLYDDLNPRFADAGYSPAAGLPQTQEELFSFYDQAALRFIASALNPENASPENLRIANQTMVNLGDMNVQRGRLGEAQIYYLRLVNTAELQINDTMKRDLYLKLADIASTQREYTESEDWYRRALVLALDADDRALIQNQIVIQIQNKFESAEANQDFATAAQEYLRMAAEYKTSNPQRYLGFQNQAQEAFIKAGQFQSAVDILLQLASERTAKEEIYALHYKAWTVADSMMNDEAQSQRIKDSFIAKYPNSNEAYTLTLLEIEKLKANPQTRSIAADKYLALYERAKAGTIDFGDDRPEDIYLWAINIYIQENQVEPRNTHFENFIQSYPNNSSSMVFMQSLADYHWAQSDTLRYEEYARRIFEKDSNESARYQHIANIKLGKIAFEFDSAYVNKNWTRAFAKRDEFVALETQYKSAGLTFDTTSAYASFTRARAEYDRIQAQIAFYARYDSQLDNLERTGFVSKTPGALISVNPNTTWRNHLFGGNPNRVPGLQTAVTAEVNRVVAILNSASEFELDNARRLRALDLISRINEHAKYAVDTQVNRYFEISVDFARNAPRNQMSAAEYEELLATMRAYAAQYTQDYLNAAYGVYLQIYNNYYTAGYRDRYTHRAKAKLEEWNVEPQYQVDQYPLGSGWTMRLADGSAMNVPVTAVTSPNDVSLGRITVPAGASVVMTKTVNTRIKPDFGFVQMVYPYDAELKVNGRAVQTPYVPADTLTAGDAMTTRFALLIENSNWQEGENSIEITIPNDASEALPLHLSLQVVQDRARLASAVPVETARIVTNASWQAAIIQPDGSEEPVSTVAAQNFGINKENILDLETTTAAPIWVQESPEATINQLSFEYSFDIATVFREGYIDFVAPQTATVLLNGVEIATAEDFYYEVQPPVYYPNRVYIDGMNIVPGRNVVKFIVDNPTQFRGFMADITIKKTIQE